MDYKNKLSDFLNDPDFFDTMKAKIDKELSNLMKIIDNVNQMRVEASVLETELMSVLDSNSWQNVASFIEHIPQSSIAFDVKREQ